MCYPEANEPHNRLMETIPKFEAALRIMARDRVAKEEDRQQIKYRVALTTSSKNTSVVIIDISMDPELRNCDAVSVYTDVDSFYDYIHALPETKSINENVAKIRHIIYADQVFVALKYPSP
jgi:hypothetical protein